MTRLLASCYAHSADLTPLAALSVDGLLEGLGLGEGEWLRWYSQHLATLQENGARQRAGGRTTVGQRELRALLSRQAAKTLGSEVVDILHDRRAVLAVAAARLSALQAADLLDAAYDSMRANYVHMHCNRLLGTRSPTETHLLHLLQRTLRSLQPAP